uniref:Cystatin domain-containing protein n=1 Tax=Leersia perrieri TaxID=77586 RepID=A0A0D9VX29_9ORYZ
MRTSTILFAAVAVAVFATVASAALEPVNDAHVQELGKWAVEEFQRERHLTGLTFNKVTFGQKAEADGGVYYYLQLEASSIYASFARYKAAVFEKGSTRTLLSFDITH